jgi:hypothetical protein
LLVRQFLPLFFAEITSYVTAKPDNQKRFVVARFSPAKSNPTVFS